MGRIKVTKVEPSYGDVSARTIKVICVLISLFLVSSGPLIYAEPTQAAPKAQMHWKLIVLSHHPACSNYDYQIMNKYNLLTEKYFELYKFENSNEKPSCFPIDKYKSNYTPSEDIDLLIVVLDKDLGREKLHSLKMGGFYTHVGEDKSDNHAIVFCDCSSFEYSDPTWILTHELSHFILYYLDYDKDIIETLIHSYDKEYDECRQTYTPECKKTITKLRIDDMSYSYSVMPIYEPAATNQVIKDSTNLPPVNDGELNQMLKKWWKEGRITQQEYQKSMALTGNNIENDSNKTTLFYDSPFENVTSWQDLEFHAKKSQDSVHSFFNSGIIAIYPQWIGLEIKTEDMSGKLIEGLWTEVFDKNMNLVESGYTPLNVTLEAKKNYTISVSDYKQYQFNKWGNGNEQRYQTLNPLEDTNLVAIFDTKEIE